MITNMTIKNVATFDEKEQYLDDFKKFNYFFGANGSGKTTISKIINNPRSYPSCLISWEHQNELETRVYNSDFVKDNFIQKFPGIFTLGQTEQETIDKIETTKKEIENFQKEINTHNITLKGEDGKGGKRAELVRLIAEYEEIFFRMKRQYENTLAGTVSGEGLKGYLGSKDGFMKKVMDESLSNKADLLPISSLEEKAKTVFSRSITTAAPIAEINFTEILNHEKNQILQKNVIGKKDIDIAAMILKLNNSDWVNQGREFYDKNDGLCPFCQQPTSENFHKSLSEYFDETFTQDSKSITLLADKYSSDAQLIQRKIQSLIDSQSPFIEIEKLKTEAQLLDSAIKINKQRLTEKQKESSRSISLDSSEDIFKKIAEIISSANTKISENNNIVSNLKKEKDTLNEQIWRFIVSELLADITLYNNKKTNINKAIKSLEMQIDNRTNDKDEKEKILKELEKQTTSIKPTLDEINKLLDTFGFKSFKLALGDEPNTYKLIRENGSDAKGSLSEGEKNFLTFLYFYHFLKGSLENTGTDNDKIVVIDDPISSLDNDVLFIVSTLIRELINDLRSDKGSIKQIFILTHNIYFHKEVTFNNSRQDDSLTEETFWLVKKNGKISSIEKQEKNPIKTSYELLWHEVYDSNRNNSTIQNTLRRILENYFKLLGGINLDKLYDEFHGDDKLKCRALSSWINDGSHSVFDEDYCTPQDPGMVDKFLDVFKQIFKKTGHIKHYNMMMRNVGRHSNDKGKL